jgi:serine/threonine protein kinase
VRNPEPACQIAAGTCTTAVEPRREALHDGYTLERELGHGGMATVYLTRDFKDDRQVALKVLRRCQFKGSFDRVTV